MKETPKDALRARCGDASRRDLRSSIRLMWVLLAWAICFAGVSQLIKRELLPPGPIPWILASLPAIAGALVILAYVRFLREADELQRLIQLQALALGFGAAFFGVTAYRVFERLGAPPADPGDFTLVMAIFYSLGSVLGWGRYR